MIGEYARVPVFAYGWPVDMRKSFGAPGKAWRFQRVKFPPWKGAKPPHQESSLGLREVTT